MCYALELCKHILFHLFTTTYLYRLDSMHYANVGLIPF